MSKLRVLIIRFTDTTAKPRVQRQLRTLDRRGIPFAVASFAPPGSHNEAVDFIALRKTVSRVARQLPDEQNQARHRFLDRPLIQVLHTTQNFTRRIVWFGVGGNYGLLPITRRILGSSFLGKKVSNLWFRLAWRKTSDYPRKIRSQLEIISFNPNLVIFHDFFTPKLGFTLSERCAARTLFDVHEHATTQCSNKAGWLKFISPMIQDIEGDAAGKSRAIVAVAEQIRTLLGGQCGQAAKTFAARSVFKFVEQPSRPPSHPLKLLYCGAISPVRGLVELVNSMVSVQKRFTLAIKGPVSNAKFESRLRQLVEELDLTQNVKVEKPCSYEEIVREANSFNIGIFVQPNTSKHKRYTLPNMFFSYIAAGLALCVSDYPELARISKEWGFAIFVDDRSPESMSAAISELSVEKLNLLKTNALATARELNWRNEEIVLIKLLEALESRSL